MSTVALNRVAGHSVAQVVPVPASIVPLHYSTPIPLFDSPIVPLHHSSPIPLFDSSIVPLHHSIPTLLFDFPAGYCSPRSRPISVPSLAECSGVDCPSRSDEHSPLSSSVAESFPSPVLASS